MTPFAIGEFEFRSTRNVTVRVPAPGMRFVAVALVLIAAMASVCSACNIPVFRYALERWKPDLTELVVFHSGPLDADATSQVDALRAGTVLHGGEANLDVVVRDPQGEIEDDLRVLWNGLSAEIRGAGPYAVVQSRTAREPAVVLWSGPFNSLEPELLFRSPARDDLLSRLLEGHSAVWVVVPGTDPKKTDVAVERLYEVLEKTAAKLAFPEGIGLPGSELYSSIPLDFRFTVLEVDPQAPAERVLVQSLRGRKPASVDPTEPLIAPVFGKGRALTVLTGERLTPDIIEDLTVFLASACSCQVKEANPGFDLLLSVNWNRHLFGETDPHIPEPMPGPNAKSAVEPELIAIAPGSGAGNSQVDERSTPPVANGGLPTQDPGRRSAWGLLSFVVLAAVMALIAGFRGRSGDSG